MIRIGLLVACCTSPALAYPAPKPNEVPSNAERIIGIWEMVIPDGDEEASVITFEFALGKYLVISNSQQQIRFATYHWSEPNDLMIVEWRHGQMVDCYFHYVVKLTADELRLSGGGKQTLFRRR